MELPNYRKLIVWQKAHQNSVDLIHAFERAPWNINRLVQQILSAATSIGANIVEGSGSVGRDRQRYWQIALNSSYELDNWIQVFKDSKLFLVDFELIEKRNYEVIRILSKLVHDLRS